MRTRPSRRTFDPASVESRAVLTGGEDAQDIARRSAPTKRTLRLQRSRWIARDVVRSLFIVNALLTFPFGRDSAKCEGVILTTVVVTVFRSIRVPGISGNLSA
jgi:hypothetical protein